MQNYEHEENKLVAGLAHASALLPVMGAIAPILIFVTQRDRSEYIRFHALQAMVYQLVATLLYFVVMGCYMIFAFVGPISMILAESASDPYAGAAGGGLMFAGFGIFMFAMCVGGPIYMIFALIAASQAINGNDYRYPILGNWLHKRYGSLSDHPDFDDSTASDPDETTADE